MDDAADIPTKRRRVDCPPSNVHRFNLIDFPEETLTTIAGYLAPPSVAMLAVALTAPVDSWYSYWWKERCNLTTAIVQSHEQNYGWEELNFGDVEDQLAAAISDDDLHAILVCIDAFTNIRRLKLAGCINIAGRGLEAIWASRTLEQLDLSMLKQHESPDLKPRISFDIKVVAPIVESIINIDGNSLKHLQIPRKPLNIRPDDDNYDARNEDAECAQRLLTRYTELLNTREFVCSAKPCLIEGCEGNGTVHQPPARLLPWIGYQCGLAKQTNTCYSCLRNFCAGTDTQDRLPEYLSLINFCNLCERVYCKSCVRSQQCRKCNLHFCAGCVELKNCGQCNELLCNNCSATCECCGETSCHRCTEPLMYTCKHNGCTRVTCIYCCDDDDNNVQCCNNRQCPQTFCLDCRRERSNEALENGNWEPSDDEFDHYPRYCEQCIDMVYDSDGEFCPTRHKTVDACSVSYWVP